MSNVTKKSGISEARASRIQDVLKSRLLDIFSKAKHFKFTDDELRNAVINDVLHSHEGKLAPRYVLAYLHGVWDCLRDDVWYRHLAWMLYLDGKLMTNKEVDEVTRQEKEELHRDYAVANNIEIRSSERESNYIPADYKSPWSRIDSDKSRHVWLDENKKPMLDKPFQAKFRKEESK